jgi:phosphohistidine phosphatase
MKDLILIRHAETEKNRDNLLDFDRRLTSDGLAISRQMADRLYNRGVYPDLIISSPAVRAVQTAEIFAGRFNYSTADISKQTILYESYEMASFINVIKATEPRIKTMFMVGHNPTFTQLAGYLCREFKNSIAKTGIVGIRFPADDWSNLNENTGKMLFYDTP